MRWITIKLHVDLETGEVLTNKVLQEEKYRILKRIKVITFKNNYNGEKTTGIINYTYECRRITVTQREIFTDSI